MPSDEQVVRIGFIGAGRMATALARGLIDAEFAIAGEIIASDVSSAARKQFADATGARSVESNEDVLADSDVVVLAVKPQQMPEVLAELSSHASDKHLIVSIAAGVTLTTLRDALGGSARLVRVMPNTPCLVGAGAAAFARAESATEDDARFVQDMFGTVGLAVEVPESLLDAVTGLSGSGPAYVFLMIEAMSDGGVCVGLPREIATRLAAQTVLGAARMVLQTGSHPGPLKDVVTSPGGTTIAGLHQLERGGLRAALINAIEAATARSIELGQS